MNNSIFIA